MKSVLKFILFSGISFSSIFIHAQNLDTIQIEYILPEGQANYHYTIKETAVDKHGFLYSVGTVDKTTTSTPGNAPMIEGLSGASLRITNADNALFLVKYNSTNGKPIWVESFEYDADAEVTGIAVDDVSNHVYVTGNFNEAIRFNATRGGNAIDLTTPEKRHDARVHEIPNYWDGISKKVKRHAQHFFVVSYDANGIIQHAFEDGGNKGFTHTNDIQIANGKVILTGHFYGKNVDFGTNDLVNSNGPSYNNITSYLLGRWAETGGSPMQYLQATDGFLAEYTADGKLFWMKSYGTVRGPGGRLEEYDKYGFVEGLDICLDKDLNPVFVGSYLGGDMEDIIDQSIVLPWNNARYGSYRRSTSNFFTAKHSINGGVFLWANYIECDKILMRKPKIESDSKGNVYLSGNCKLSAHVDESPYIVEFFNNTNSGSTEMLVDSTRIITGFLAKYSTHGNVDWIRKIRNVLRVSDITSHSDKILVTGNSSSFGHFILEGASADLIVQHSQLVNPIFFTEYDAFGNPSNAFVDGNKNFISKSIATGRGAIYLNSSYDPLNSSTANFNGEDSSQTLTLPTSVNVSTVILKYTDFCTQFLSINLGVIFQNGQLSPSGSLLALRGTPQYQWFHNGSPIVNATGINHTPTQPGNYYLQITNSRGCVLVSSIYKYISRIIRQSDLTFENQGSSAGSTKSLHQIHAGDPMFSAIKINAFPNPFLDHVTLQIESPMEQKNNWIAQVTDIQGKIITQQTITIQSGVNSFSIGALANLDQGSYFITVQNTNGDSLYKNILIK